MLSTVEVVLWCGHVWLPVKQAHWFIDDGTTNKQYDLTYGKEIVFKVCMFQRLKRKLKAESPTNEQKLKEAEVKVWRRSAGRKLRVW